MNMFSKALEAAAYPDLNAPLPPQSVYRSQQGREKLMELYQKSIADLPFPISQRTIHTSFGRTHLSIAGDPTNPPLLILPGMSIISPLMLDFFATLQKSHLLIAPDLIGQPGYSEDRPFSTKNHAYGKWAFELLDGLRLEKMDVAAASFGGSIALEMAHLAPERIGKMALVVPAGLTPNLPYLRLYAGLAVNWLTYRFWPFGHNNQPNYGWLQHIVKPLSHSLTRENLDYFHAVIRHTAFWQHEPAGPFGEGDFSKDMEPVFAAFARKDYVFPFAQTLQNARANLPMAEMVILEESAHMPSKNDMAPIHKQISAYFNHK